VLGLEVSRLARRNADGYQLLDLCALTNTLIADADRVYHPGFHNDSLLLGLKGTMSEAELHVLRTRMREGALHKVAKGEVARGAPCGSGLRRARAGSDHSGRSGRGRDQGGVRVL
jgi:DNA invertase Pin-like site-specific DNA recombinase